jgi:hypothetical protein
MMYNVLYTTLRVVKMTQMIRKQIYIQKRQQTLLKRLAKARGTSEAEIIREAIDQQAAGGTAHQLPLDEAAWEQARAFIEKRRKQGVQGQPYQWRREDAYDERLSRFNQLAGRKAKP